MFNRPINRWWTVLAGAMGCAAGAGVVGTYAFGIFIKAISTEYGWDRSATTAGISCFYFASGIGALVWGSLTARWSLRWTTMAWVIIFSLSVASVAILPQSVLLLCLVFAVMGFFGAAATAMPYAVAIASWFDRNRGLALAIAVSGTGVAGAFMSRYANWLMSNFGWRGGYVGVALFVGLVGVSALLLFFREPPRPSGSQESDPGPTLVELYTRNRTFWIIALPVFTMSLALIGTITNFAPIMTDRGLSMGDAAAYLGILGAASWFSRIGLGVFLDRIHVRFVSATMFLVTGSGCALILSGASGHWIAVSAILIGLGMGAETDLMTYTVSRYFPQQSLSRALGAIWNLFACGSALGVFTGSLSFDLTGSYDAALALYLICALISLVVILRLGPYRYQPHASENQLGVAVQPAQ